MSDSFSVSEKEERAEAQIEYDTNCAAHSVSSQSCPPY